MKRILLSSAAVVAFAGAAAAQDQGVTFTGNAELGYNNDALGDHNGFYGGLDLGVHAKRDLDNGVSVSADWDIEFDDDQTAGNLRFDDVLLSLEAEGAAMYFGTTSFAAEDFWTAAGDMEQDGFSEASDELVLKGTMSFGNIDAAISYVAYDDRGNRATDGVEQLSFGASADLGNFTVGAAYQDDVAANAFFGDHDRNASTPDQAMNADGNSDFNNNKVYGVFATTTLGAADLTLAYAKNDTANQDSLGLQVAYPVGPVTATVYYVDESNGAANYGMNLAYSEGAVAVALDYDNDQGVDKWGLEGSYDMGNGLTIFAGFMTQDATNDRYYVAGSYDMGNGASLLVSHAEDSSNVDTDEIGANDYQRGTTIELNFAF